MGRIFAGLSFFLKFVPLSIFLRVAFWNGRPQTEDWLSAFLWAGGAAALQLLLLIIFRREIPLDRMILGVDVYLIIGGTFVVSGEADLLKLLYMLKESGVSLCVLFVGIFTTFLTPSGFVGVLGKNNAHEVKFYSIILLLIACIAVLVSFLFRGNMLFSAIVPLIFLSISMHLFKRRLNHSMRVTS